MVNAPTDLDGRAPYVDDVVIKSVTDATNLVASSELTTTQSNVAITISDILDIDVASMNEVIYYKARLELAKVNRLDPVLRSECEKDYAQALYSAKCQASESSSVRVAGQFGNRLGVGGWGIWDAFYTLS